jgi:hypothetical protein
MSANQNWAAMTGDEFGVMHLGDRWAWWKKSSRSASDGHCVEVAHMPEVTIGVRDSKDNGRARYYDSLSPAS